MAADAQMSSPLDHFDAHEMLDALATGLMVLDAQLCVVYANVSAQDLLSLSLRQTRGHPVPGEVIVIEPGPLRLTLRGRTNGHWLAEPDPPGTPAELLAKSGRVPLPPYIRKGQAGPADRERYQTVYARADGSVAAPTAGLHFTQAVLDRLDARGIATATVTLHVGLGTFEPMKTDDPAQHRMHAEWGEVSQATADAIAASERVVCIGTTSLRLLESVARTGPVRAWTGETDIFITPGFEFRVADLLPTNFHLPRSTLFMLVSAFAGLERMQAAYAHAVAGRYRFYSYGDCCLLRR